MIGNGTSTDDIKNIIENIDPKGEKFLLKLIKNFGFDMSTITLEKLNEKFTLNIMPQDVEIGFIEWLGMCVKMIFFDFSIFCNKNYHVSQHLLLIKYIDRAKSELSAQNKTRKMPLQDLISKLKQNNPQIQNQQGLKANELENKL